jgi:hypothetical protein
MVSIVASMVISKFLHYIILVTISAKNFIQQNFNLKMTRIQRGVGSWMLFEKGLVKITNFRFMDDFHPSLFCLL